MVRKAEFDDDIFISATIKLISAGGPTAATMAAIAHNTGAPTGSIYHRFKSRTALLGQVWLQCMTAMTKDILPLLNKGHSCDAIKAFIDWAIKNPAMARIIMLYSENDLIDGDLPPDIYNSLNDVNRQLGKGLSNLLKHRGSPLTASNLALANFAIFDGPIAAMKPYLRDKRPSPMLDQNKLHRVAVTCGRATLELLD